MEARGTPNSAAKTTVATYGNYAEAERAVDFLSDKGFPVERIAIVGTGLKTVEQVAGRLTTGRAAIAGGTQGATLGLLFALLFGLFFEAPEFFGLLLYGLIAGALFGAASALSDRRLSGGAATSPRSGGCRPNATRSRPSTSSRPRPSSCSSSSRNLPARRGSTRVR